MGRPGDWSVLGYSGDPIDADSDEIKDEATHYELVADAITSQIATLRHLANEGVGDYADALRESCDKLANNLEKAEGRFRTVAEELNKLVPEVDEALSETHLARIQAENAQQGMDDAVRDGHVVHGPPAADAESTASGTDPAVLKSRYDTASGNLGAARTRAQNAVSAWNSVAEAAAERIRRAADDDMKDGRFEGFKAWVKKHAELLRTIAQILTAIVVILSVIILLVSNPAGWLVAIAMIASVALLATQVALAVAGEGSWSDVALTALGIVTLGAARPLAALGRFARSSSLFRLGSGRGIAAALSRFTSGFSATGRFSTVRSVFNGLRPSAFGNAFRSGRDAFRGVVNFPRGAGSMVDDLARLRLEFGDDLFNAYGTIANIDRIRNIADTALLVNTAGNATGFPGIADLNGILGDLTTREVSSL